MRRRGYLHRLLGNVHSHRAVALYVGAVSLLQPFAPDTACVERHAAVLRSPSRGDLGRDREGQNILIRAFALVAVTEHEPFAFAVAQHSALIEKRRDHALSGNRQRPDGGARLELDKLHIRQLCPGVKRHCHGVPAEVGGVRRKREYPAEAARGEDHRFRLDLHPAFALRVKAVSAAHSAVFRYQAQGMERGADADIFVLLHDGKQLSEDRAAGIVADADDPRARCPEGSELLIAPIRLAVEVQAKLIEKRQKLKAAPAQLFNERRVALTSAGSLCILYEKFRRILRIQRHIEAVYIRG